MSKVKGAKKKVAEEKLSAFESAFGKLSVAGATTKEGGEDTGIVIAREDTGSVFNPIAPQLSHLFNGPSHLLPSPAKIYSSFMEGLLKKAHTQVPATATATVAAAAAQQPSGAEDNGDSAMQLDAPAEAVDDKKEHTAAANGVDDASTSKNVRSAILTLLSLLPSAHVRALTLLLLFLLTNRNTSGRPRSQRRPSTTRCSSSSPPTLLATVSLSCSRPPRVK